MFALRVAARYHPLPKRLPLRQPYSPSIVTPYRTISFTRTRQNVPTPPSGATPPKGPTTLVKRTFWALKGLTLLIGSTIVGVGVLGGVIFLHDAFTYSDDFHGPMKVHELALNPRRGGPKNLPIADKFLGDEESEEMAAQNSKPRLVIIGGGWGAMGILKTLNPGDYHVTIVAPETYNQFTPLLPSAAVGTVSVRSLMESIRKMLSDVSGHFVQGKAVDLVMSERLLEVETLTADKGKTERIYIPYDKLVIACGSISAAHGVKGLGHCFQLKSIKDAQDIRRRILENFEIASLPTTSPEERKRLLSFVVCGGGPTGVETAAEIYDLCQEDIVKYYPKLLREEFSIHIVQSRDHILNTYSENISKYAEQKFQREGVDLITNARVKEVLPDRVIYTVKVPGSNTVEEYEIPTNFVLWSTGIAMNPFTERVSNLLPNQVHQKAIVVDAHLRVKGAPLGTVYAVGDASTTETSLLSYLLDLVDNADVNKDGKIDFDEWKILVKELKKRVPMSSKHVEKVREIFEAYDQDHDNVLGINELTTLLVEIGNKITAHPATAQVASQEGKYLGFKFSKLAKQRRVLTANDMFDDDDASFADPFEYHHLGSLAYIGNAAVFDYKGTSVMGGLAAMYAWRSVYWSEQVSMRTRVLLMMDWIIRGIWGRDLSKL